MLHILHIDIKSKEEIIETITIYDNIIKRGNTQNINIALSNLLYCHIKKGDQEMAIKCLNDNEERDITLFTSNFFKQALYIACHTYDNDLFTSWYEKYRSSRFYNDGSIDADVISLFKDFMDEISHNEIAVKAEEILKGLKKNIDNKDDIICILEILYHLAKDDGDNDKALSIMNELYDIMKMDFSS